MTDIPTLTVRMRRAKQVLVKGLRVRYATELQRAQELVAQDIQRLHGTVRAAGSDAEQSGTAQQYATGAQRDRLGHIGAAPDEFRRT